MTPSEQPAATPETDNTKVLLSWKAKPYHVHQRDSAWYTKAGVAAVALAVFAIATSAWTFAVVILLSVGVYFLLRNHAPEEQTIEILDDGIRCRGAYWHWNDLKGFTIKHTPLFTELHLMPAVRRRMPIVIQTGDTDVRFVREILSARLTQLSDADESLLDSFIRFCKL